MPPATSTAAASASFALLRAAAAAVINGTGGRMHTLLPAAPRRALRVALCSVCSRLSRECRVESDSRGPLKGRRAGSGSKRRPLVFAPHLRPALSSSSFASASRFLRVPQPQPQPQPQVPSCIARAILLEPYSYLRGVTTRSSLWIRMTDDGLTD